MGRITLKKNIFVFTSLTLLENAVNALARPTEGIQQLHQYLLNVRNVVLQWNSPLKINEIDKGTTAVFMPLTVFSRLTH